MAKAAIATSPPLQDGVTISSPPVRFEKLARAPPPATIASAAAHNLPLAMTRMIGREEVVATLVSRVSRERVLTIVGPGGIGKTTVALAVAERIISDYEHGVWLIDLSPLGDPRLVPSAVATVLGLEVRTDNPLPGLIAALRDRRMLLLLDNCEHVIDAAASLAAAILGGARDVSILLTTREPLGIPGEHVYRVGPLSTPQHSARVTAAETAAFTAIQLFVERVTAIVEDFALTDENASTVAEICRRLDGLPLAIEFAAPRVEVLGVEALASHLGAGLPQLRARVRASPPRHRTMRAVVDWSYGLLSEDEQRFLRALGIFAGGFTVEAAAAVAIDASDAPGEAIDRLADLVAKSLVVADVSGASPRFRLLDTTRAYAIEKLDESGDRERRARRHAEYYRKLFACAEAEWEVRPTAEWLADYAGGINDLRAALDWAFFPDGDVSTGIALTVAAVPLWMHLSLMDECRSRVSQALAVLAVESNQDVSRGMKLYAALATSLIYIGARPNELEAAWAQSLELAERLDDTEYRLRAAWELWTLNRVSRWHRAALTQAQSFCALAANSADPNHRLIGERILGVSYHYLGDQVRARRHLQAVLDQHVDSANQSHIVRFQVDLCVSARTFLAPVIWLLGFPDQAMRAAEDAVEAARVSNHVLSICHALVFGACPTALLAGDVASGGHYVSTLTDYSTMHGLARWHAYGCGYRGALLIKRGDKAAGLQLLHAGSDELGGFATLRFMDFLMPEALCLAGEIAEGLAAVDCAITRSEQSEELRLLAELLRIKGELLLLQRGPGAVAAAEDHFRQALDWARRQGALSWELRAATSLARLLRNRGRSVDAIACLQPVYDRFTEGFGTADLIAAKLLLDELGLAHHD
ncbi:MAG: hypothetical protein E6G73_09425 [Alphaproteobacteria bacterium]|nr:MAG: hypothetical protein E6G73_09425 [Alphaproteobacteria bacterium]